LADGGNTVAVRGWQLADGGNAVTVRGWQLADGGNTEIPARERGSFFFGEDEGLSLDLMQN
jgi:hypothetical protein